MTIEEKRVWLLNFIENADDEQIETLYRIFKNEIEVNPKDLGDK